MSRKKRNKQYLKEKQLIGLRMKDAENTKAIRNQSWVELEEPIHNGYHAEYVLREDILRRDDAEFYQEALNACMEKIWARNPEFRFKNKKTKRWENINPKLKDINKETYEGLSPQAKKFFYESLSKKGRWRYGFSDKWYACTLSYELVVKVSKSYITHRKEHDSILYQTEAEIEKRMNQIAGNGNPWGYNHNGYSHWWKKHENRKEKLRAGREIVETVKAFKGLNKNDKLTSPKHLRELE